MAGRKNSGSSASSERTKNGLYQEAKKGGIEDRSTVTKQPLKSALGH
ncbi:hypothetical protein [Streptomyces sp. MJM1172]|nr:hypothetical protein [Streptomyces sp. MJM1172]